MLLDLRAFSGAAQVLEATAPNACAAHGGAEAIIAGGRPVVSGGGFWSFVAKFEVWEAIAAEAQAEFRGNAGLAVDKSLTLGRTG